MQFVFTKLFIAIAASAIAAAVPAIEIEARSAFVIRGPSPATQASVYTHNEQNVHLDNALDDAIQPSPQDFNVGEVWTDANKGGTGGFLNVGGIPSGCRVFHPPFNDSISSIQVDTGIGCTFFVDVNCMGASKTVNATFVPDLANTPFQDSLSSFRCFAL